MKRLIKLILLILLGITIFSCHGCHTETTKDTIPNREVRDTALIAGWFTIPNDVVYWLETEDLFDPNDPDKVVEDRFYTNDLARAQDRVPFPIVLPGYIPDKAKRISGPCIEGPLIAESDNETEIIVRYDVYLGDKAWSEIFITESNTPYTLGDPELNPDVKVIEIGGKKVLKTEFDHPLGPAIYLSFNLENIYFVVELYNFPADEAMKIVESIITEPAIVPETETILETEIVLETEILLEPDISSATLLPENTIAATIAGIEARLNSLELSGATVKKQDGNLIVVQLPKVGDIDLVIALITSRGELDLREQVLDAHGLPVLDEEGNQQWVIAKAKGSDGQERELTGKYLKPNAEVVLEPHTDMPEVEFEWNEEGAILFEQITQRNLEKPLGIFLDDRLISAPTVMMPIIRKAAIPVPSLDEAKTLAIQLNSGALPVPLRVVRIVSIGEN